MAVVYLDNAASTRPAVEVMEATARAARDLFANPSSVHAAGAAAARELERARAQVAQAMGAAPADVVFTAGGTEANAMGILGAAARARPSQRHVVVTAIEHNAVLKNAERLAKQGGFTVTVVPVDGSGIVRPDAVAAAVRPDTAVVAVMLVNNELGTVQPVAAVAEAVAAAARDAAGTARPDRAQRPHLHVDAVQALGVLPFRVASLGADSVAVSGHKIHGPKGTGALWARPGSKLGSLWDGGGQERTLRSGTENLPGIVGLARAVELAAEARAGGALERMAALRDQLEARARAALPGVVPTVGDGSRTPHISSLSLPGLPAEPLLHALEARNVMASAGSACSSKTRGPSHVLKAIGVDDRTAVLRFSLSRETTEAEIVEAAAALAAAVAEIAGLARRS